MRRLKKNYYLAFFCCAVAILGIIRWVAGPSEGANNIEADTAIVATADTTKGVQMPIVATPEEGENPTEKRRRYHPIYSVSSYSRTFPDLQDVQIVSAKKHGVTPVKNRAEAEHRKKELVYIGANPFYKIDPGMNRSIPYLVPRAATALETIARNYLDSLHVKGIPLHKILVSSVLRTEEDVRMLMRHNPNASPESCHRYGTTFDIPYNRYHTVSPPNEHRREVRNDSLKWVLAEVLRDLREQGQCYVKYEVKQGCFHITVR